MKGIDKEIEREGGRKDHKRIHTYIYIYMYMKIFLILKFGNLCKREVSKEIRKKGKKIRYKMNIPENELFSSHEKK